MPQNTLDAFLSSHVLDKTKKMLSPANENTCNINSNMF